MKLKFSVSKIMVFASIVISPVVVNAQVPVTDGGSIAQQVNSYLTQYQQYLEMVNQTKTQIDMYTAMIENAKSPNIAWYDKLAAATNLYSSLNDSMGKMRGNMLQYISSISSAKTVMATQCLSKPGGCNDDQRRILQKQDEILSERIKLASDMGLQTSLNSGDLLNKDVEEWGQIDNQIKARGENLKPGEVARYSLAMQSQAVWQLQQIRLLLINLTNIQSAIAAKQSKDWSLGIGLAGAGAKNNNQSNDLGNILNSIGGK